MMVRGRIVHVGLHKTATTWLQARFFPAVGGTYNSPGPPWDDPVISGLVKGGSLPPLPQNCIISAERLGGHPHSGWYDADKIADRIRSAIPNARIVVGYRAHESWAPSIYQQLVANGETRTLEDLLTPSWVGPHMDMSMVSLDALEERYGSRFEDVLFLPLERLRRDPSGYIRDLSEFLGITPPDVDLDPVNRSEPMNVELRRKLNHFRTSRLNGSPLIDLGRVSSWTRVFRRGSG